MLDLVVVGAGLAGLSAAYHAARAGLSVRVVAKGMGSLHWTPGTLDVLGYRPGAEAGRPAIEAVARPLEAAAALPSTHPYRRLSVGELAAALDDFAAAAAAAGLPYLGGPPGGNLSLPSPVGAARPTYLAPAAQAAGRLDDDRPMRIVGFRGLRDFYPKLIAENLAAQGHAAAADFLDVHLITPRRDFNTVILAEQLEVPGRAARLGQALARLVHPDKRIGLPAILGMEEHGRVLAEVADAAGAPIFEIPTLPPGVPGQRLFRALRHALARLGVRVEVGMEVIAFHAEDSRVRWVETATSARPLRHRAASFLLATGGVLGGGFTSDHTGRFWETVFDLPLDAPHGRAAWFRPAFFDPQGQPVFYGGVKADARWRPLGAGGAPAYENLYVAGGALAGADPLQERSLEGIAWATGRAAAHALAAAHSSASPAAAPAAQQVER